MLGLKDVDGKPTMLLPGDLTVFIYRNGNKTFVRFEREGKALLSRVTGIREIPLGERLGFNTEENIATLIANLSNLSATLIGRDGEQDISTYVNVVPSR